MTGTDGTRRRADAWLMTNGLPLVVRPVSRARDLLARCTPFLVFALPIVLASLWVVATVPEAELERPSSRLDAASWAAVGVLVASPVVGVLLASVAGLALLRLSPRHRATVGAVAALAWVALPGLVTGQWLADAAQQLVSLLVVLAAGYAGIGALAFWAVRRTWRELATIVPMVVRVLPILMLTVLFLFFNAEVWQIASRIGPARVAAVAGVLMLLSASVVVSTGLDELRDLPRRALAATSSDPLARTPYSGRGDIDPATARRLNPAERVNFALLPMASQGIQVLIFGVLMTVFFLAFGELAIADSVETLWTARVPQPVVFGLTATLIKVAVVLGAFCGLSFAASSSADAAYRDTFLEPILTDAQRGLWVRAAYRREP